MATKILIVEDDATTRLLLRKLMKLNNVESVETTNGEDALQLLSTTSFDAVVTDWMMPKMNGMELIEKIRTTIKPAPFIVMLTAISTEEAKRKSLEIGADVFLAKPFSTPEIVNIVRNGLLLRKQSIESAAIIDKNPCNKKTNSIAVAIASSTGGPQTLLKLFSKIHKTDKAVFFLVQHGPEWMLESFVNRLQEVTTMNVHLAKHNLHYHPGGIYLAPGEKHMTLNIQANELLLNDDPPENYCKPAADPLFRSVAAKFCSNSIGIVLTGMGRDGTIGAGYIAANGGTVIAQEPEEAIIASMPQSIIDLRIAHRVCTVESMAETLNKYFSQNSVLRLVK